MTTRLNSFEQFILLFEAVKRAAKDNPRQLRNFYDESNTIREAVDGLRFWLMRMDFERRVFHGSRKHFPQVPVDFEKAWAEYKELWETPVTTAWTAGLDREMDKLFPVLPPAEPLDSPKIWIGPDPDYEEEFDPLEHDGGKALEMGIQYLADREGYGDYVIENIGRISTSAYDYLTETIGIDVPAVFRRWRNVPVTFMPTHVSNKHGLTEKGSLYALLDDAVRAYVCGAPAAAITMCRAALEMVLKRHYGRGQWDDLKLGKIIVLADQKYEFVQAGRIRPLVDRTNGVLHNYSNIEQLSKDEDRAILNFLKTVKFLIQRAPKR